MRALPDDQPSRKKALLIGGGAPNATLMAGALVAMIDHGVEFDVVSTSGAGALIGLLYLAPRGHSPRTALERTVRMGIADEIYRCLPVNYKVFHKPGPLADLVRQGLAANPLLRESLDHAEENAASRVIADWWQLLIAGATPSALGPQDLGLCAPVPFIEDVVDFAAVPGLKVDFYVNAFNVTRQMMAIWSKDRLTAEHFRAALAYPLIYPPYRVDGEDYIEGATIDTLNFRALVAESGRPAADAARPADGPVAEKAFLCDGQARTRGLHHDLDTLVVFDILGSERLIRRPRHLYDAWVQSIITPLVEIARDDLRLFDLAHNRNADGSRRRRLLKVPLLDALPPEALPEVMDWSRSNLERLFEIGRQAGEAFCRTHRVALNLA